MAAPGSGCSTRPHPASDVATPEERNRLAEDLQRLYREGRLTVTIDRELALADAKAAHDAMEGRLSKGKFLLKT